MAWGALSVMMWKHLMVRKKRYIKTIIEIITPTLLFFLLNSLMDDMNEDSDFDMENVTHTEILALNSLSVPKVIYYYPDTAHAGMIMDAVGETFGYPALIHPPPSSDKFTTGYVAVPDRFSLANYARNLRGEDAIVILQNMHGPDWPDRLNYTIRIKSHIYTNSIDPTDDEHVSQMAYGTNYEAFIRLQWALETTFIKLSEDEDEKIWVQKFPEYRTGEPNPEVVLLCMIIPVISWLSLLPSFVLLTSSLLVERTTGIQELIKMVGVSPFTLALSHVLNVMPGALAFALTGGIVLTKPPNVLIPNTSGIYIFTILFLYFMTIVSMAFFASYIARSTHFAASIGIMSYVALSIPNNLLKHHNVPRYLVPLTGLLPHVAFDWFWKQLGDLEMIGKKVSFDTMFKTRGDQSLSIFWCYILLIVQAALFFLLAWYLSHVRPGQYGRAKPWNFVFKKEVWVKPKNDEQSTSSADEEAGAPVTRDPKYFEDPPKNMDVGIKVQNLTKVFGKNKVLDNLTLDVYKGEITVLLGHNGAGKTTLMSIITGMTSATTGKVWVNGMDTQTQMAAVRRQLGLCPQHNLFFADLTALEHVMFFTMLKSSSYNDAKVSSRELLRDLGLSHKQNSSSGKLSGGMQRRLQLACALAGGAAVLVLDEPTSGLDVETRRNLWDLLLTLRGDRTVLLTTHFMEEADALGDRVAALYAGQLRLHATPMFLKKAIGTGYRLTFTTNGAPNESAITSVITAQVPDATVKETTMNSISYSLPTNDTSQFPKLFSTLEAKREQLGIATIGVGVSTLEEVFLRLCSDVDTTFTADDVVSAAPEPVFQKVTGMSLYMQQLRILLYRQFRFTVSKKISFLILQFLLPICMICLFVDILNNEAPSKDEDSSEAEELGLHRRTPSQHLSYFTKQLNGVEFDTVPHVDDSVLHTGKDAAMEKHIVGIEINETDAKVLYMMTVRHAALLSNVLAAAYVQWADERTLAAYNAPYDEPFAELKEPKSKIRMFVWAMWISCVILATLINVAELPCTERSRGSRHTHVLAGASPALHWAATLLFHVAGCAALLVAATLGACLVLERDRTVDQPSFMVTAAVIFLVGCSAFLALTYQLSFCFNSRGTSIVLIFCVIVFGVIVPPLSHIVKRGGWLHFIVHKSEYLSTPHTLVMTMAKAGHVARLNAYCKLNRDKCPELEVPAEGFDSEKCCANKNPGCNFCFKKYAPLKGIFTLLAQFIVLMTTVILSQYGVFNRLYDKMRNSNYDPLGKPSNDKTIRAEADYVYQTIKLPEKQIPDVMLVNDIHKKYNPIMGRTCNAVKGVSFSVKKGECFGVLGVNGAGKSTMFKMITAEECTTRGSLFANEHHLHKERMPYLRSLSYCPQFSGIDPFLTGRENLTLLLTLRGLQPKDVAEEVKSWINVVGLEKYAERAVSGYSGGCARRLAAAAALSTAAPLTLLDEPTAGVDVAARRRVWAALRRALASRALIICSHSMDEMEALCGRMCIVAGGSLVALGAAATLRAEHAAGHAVRLKVRPSDTHTDELKLEELKSQLQRSFNCTLKDEHKTMLRYHINEMKSYSELFEVLEELKATYPDLIEDYAITETTLEEVFLTFAERYEQIA